MTEKQHIPEPGTTRVDEFTVEDELVTDVAGALPRGVLSTPGMISMMERTALSLALEHLPAGQATVGFEVNIRHVGAAYEGSVCRSSARLREVAEGRKWRFDVEVSQDDRVIGVGTHERRLMRVEPAGSLPGPAPE